jgi:hypothetical protein
MRHTVPWLYTSVNPRRRVSRAGSVTCGYRRAESWRAYRARLGCIVEGGWPRSWTNARSASGSRIPTPQCLGQAAQFGADLGGGDRRGLQDRLLDAGRGAQRAGQVLGPGGDRLDPFQGAPLGPSSTLLTPPTAADAAELDVLAGEIGAVPVALDACLRYVGGVWFAGDCPALDESYLSADQYAVAPVLLDPLVLPDVKDLRYSWKEYRELAQDDPEVANEGFVFDFAPDELHNANISGSTHDISLVHRVADPVIQGVGGRPGITLIDCLRLSISWGGMPGWSFKAEYAPVALAGLRAHPDF